MKPEDLIPPHSWDDRSVAICDRVFYVPKQLDNYHAFTFPGWGSSQLFGNQHDVKVEYCSGNGSWIANRAEKDKAVNWLAIEMKFKRVRKIWSKVKNHQLDNLIVLCGEGNLATQLYFPDDSISEIFINFPDPWPKKRHWKNRIMQIPFLKNVHRVLKPGGVITFVTDDAPYSEWTLDLFSKCPEYEPVFPAPHYVTEYADYGNSYFEDLWRSQEKEIRYHQFRKQKVI